MKTFFVVCLAVAAALADSEPQLLLNSPFYSGLAAATYPYQQPLALQQPLSYYAAAPADTKVVEVVEEKKDVVDVVEVAEKVEKVEVPKTVVYAAAPQQVFPYAAYPYATPIVQQQQVQVVPKYFAKNGEVEHIVAKREAEADAQMIYSAAAYNPYVYSSAVAQPFAYNAQPIAYKTIDPIAYKTIDPLAGVQAKTYANDFSPFTQGYASKGMYVADSVGAVHIAKREAEAEPEADAQMIYSTAAYNPYMYSSAVAQPFAYNAQPIAYKAQPFAYNAMPFAYNAQPIAYKTINPIAYKTIDPLAGVQAKTYANDFSPFTQDYAAKGTYVADSVGAVHVAKREAEAEPQYLSNYYSNPLWNVAPYRSAAYSAYYPYSAYPAYTGAYSAYSGLRYL